MVIARGGVGLALFVVLALLPATSLHAETPEEIFERGNEAYSRDDWVAAVQAYQLLLDYRISDPRVEYNMGNAQFRLGRLGHAILHFERARRLDPTDEDTLANLAFARTRCVDEVALPGGTGLVRWVQRRQDQAGPDLQAWIAVGLLWTLSATIAWGLARPGRWSATLGWAAMALSIAMVLTAASWYVTFDRLEGRRLAVVLDDVVDVRAGPGANNASLFTVHEGLTVQVRDIRQDWIQVSLPNGLNGWVLARAVGLV